MGHVNKNFLLLCTLLTLNLIISINGVAGDDRLKRAIEEEMLTAPFPPTLPNDGSKYKFTIICFMPFFKIYDTDTMN